MIGDHLNRWKHFPWGITLLFVLITVVTPGSMEVCESRMVHRSTTNPPAYMLIVGTSERIINETLQISNTSIGVKVVPADCNEIEIRNQILQEVLANTCYAEGVSAKDSRLIGVIGPDKLYFHQTLQKTSIPYFVIGEMNIHNNECQRTDENVIPAGVNITQHAKAIAELAVRIDWDYTTVLYDEPNELLKNVLEQELKSMSVCVDEYLNVDKLSTRINTNGAIVLAMASQESWTSYLNHSTVIWSYISHTNSTKDSTPGFGVNKSMYIIEPCQSVAIQISSIITNNISQTYFYHEKMKCVNVTSRWLTKDAGRQSPFFDVTFENETISNYNGSVWSLELRATSGSRSWCTEKTCQDKCSKQIVPKNYIYEHGEYIILVTTNIHETSNKYPNQYTCTRFHKEVSLRSEAALFARKQINELIESTTGVPKFGVLILDSCLSTLITQRLLTDALHGNTPYCDQENHCLNRSKIIGLVGDFSSHIGIAEQLLMMPANLLQVAYGSAIHKLDNKDIYKNLLRVHNSNTRVTSNVVKLITDMNRRKITKINSVVLVTSSTDFGITGGDLLEKKLKESSYCIQGERIQLNYTEKYEDVKKNYTDYWTKLSQSEYYSNSSLVLVYNGEEKSIREFLDALNSNKPLKDWWRRNGGIFIMVAVWEDKISLLKKYGDVLAGSLSFKIDPKFTVKGYKDYLVKDIMPRAKRNPWFARAYQELKGCKIAGDFSTDLKPENLKPCVEDKEYATSVTTDIYTTNLIKAMFTFGYGIEKYLDKTKLSESTQPYTRKQTIAKELKNFMKDIKIPKTDNVSDSPDLSPFNDQLDGTGGYVVYSQQYTGERKFVHVYNFTEDDEIRQNATTRPDFYKNDQLQDQLIALQCNDKCSTLCDSIEKGIDLAVTLLAVALALVTIAFVAFLIRNLSKKYGYGKLICKWLRCNSPRESESANTSNANDTSVTDEEDTDVDIIESVSDRRASDQSDGNSMVETGGEVRGGDQEEIKGEDGNYDDDEVESHNESPRGSIQSDYEDCGISVSFQSNASGVQFMVPQVLKGPDSVNKCSHKRRPIPKPRISICSE